MAKTSIEWTDTVWNPVTGCTKVSEGCRNCYAERMSKRLAGRCGYPADNPFRVVLHPEKLDEPSKWKKPRRIFVNSMSDLFHEDVPFEFIRAVWARMVTLPQHTFMILTKRPERMLEFFIWMDSQEFRVETFRSNVWLGVSAENQGAANKRIPLLLRAPVLVRFVSCEPLLGPINLERIEPMGVDAFIHSLSGTVSVPFTILDNRPKLDWVIAGGESGPGARPMHPDWASGLRDQCQAAGIPYFFKQWGEWKTFYDRDQDDPDWQNIPEEKPNIRRLNFAGGHGFHGDRVVYLKKVGKKKAGRELDGRTWNEIPKL
ncbi:phage protein Gp37/Gp68 [Desulfosporosinus acididurans]|uniref:Phage protein Gp37/Gp68 n=1 Tax=Desulfosporosinus acididurans TaxID=476652 RepID=A0A0J1FUQ0_9FIRM|nr:phage Gp37/Gp68 family protein [Desulfosporosinus acididurans]KLU66723.1 phage protein Gp37/Gp68 [Desulfosporosinus acididurans]